MKIEDVTIDHMRRKAVVTVQDGYKEIVSIPVGFVYEKIAMSDPNTTRWHDRQTCPEILDPWTQIDMAWGHGYKYHFIKCFGQCVPNQKIIPWDKDRFLKAYYTFIPNGYKVKRTVKFANGEEVWHYKEDVRDD